MSDALLPGFADPVHDAQAAFRAVLDAMARPGTIGTVGAPALSPAPLDRATAAVLLTLADAETPVWLDGRAAAARAWLAFHAGSPAAGLEAAAVAVALGPVPLESLPAGTDDAPELGATLVLQVAALGAGEAFVLEGPGLAGPAAFRATGLPPGFARAWAANHARFPRGIDLLLCAGDRVAAFPRSLSVREG